jgi:hypothetical protein
MEREGWVVDVLACDGHDVRVYFQSFEQANAFISKHPHYSFLERFHVSRYPARTEEPAQAERSASTLSRQEAAEAVIPGF